MGSEAKCVHQGEKGALSLVTNFVEISSVAAPHESGSVSLLFIASLAAVRQTESMPQFVSDTSDEDGIVFSE